MAHGLALALSDSSLNRLAQQATAQNRASTPQEQEQGTRHTAELDQLDRQIGEAIQAERRSAEADEASTVSRPPRPWTSCVTGSCSGQTAPPSI